MAEPALAVLWQASGGAVAYRAQWGGTRERLAAVCGGASSEPRSGLFDCEWHYEGVVRESIPDFVDYLRTTAVYVLTPGEVVPFLPVWFGFPPAAEPDPSAGALLRVDSLAEVERCRRLVRRAKGYLAARLTAGECTLGAAVTLLWQCLGGRELYGSTPLRRLGHR